MVARRNPNITAFCDKKFDTLPKVDFAWTRSVTKKRVSPNRVSMFNPKVPVPKNAIREA